MTGTDTGAGKTYVSALVIQALRAEGVDAVGYKPICCGGREAAYYVRAIQETTEVIHGDPFRCEYDAAGMCVKTSYCVGIDKEDDCLSPAQHRAWSSPIYVRSGQGLRQAPDRGP